MKRLYRVTVTIEATFDRLATREAKNARDRLLAARPDGWHAAPSRITNRAKPERVAPMPSPAMVEEEIAAGQILASLREIADDMARILGNVKKPRVAYAPNRWCDGKFGRNCAHTHVQGGVRWIRGPRAGRRIPKGLICLSRREFLASRGWTRPERWVELMAHEIMHVRMPGGSHRRAKFNPAVTDLVEKYAAFKAGTWTPSVRSPPRRSFAMTTAAPLVQGSAVALFSGANE